MYSVIKLTQWSSRRLHTIHCFVLGAEVKKKMKSMYHHTTKKNIGEKGCPVIFLIMTGLLVDFFFSFFLRKVTHSRCVKRELSKNVSWHGIVSNYRFYPFTHGYHLKKKKSRKKVKDQCLNVHLRDVLQNYSICICKTCLTSCNQIR